MTDEKIYIVVIEGEFDTPTTDARISGPYVELADAVEARDDFRSRMVEPEKAYVAELLDVIT